MRFLSLACLLTALLAPRAASAGTTVVFRRPDGAKMRWFAEGSRVRIQNFHWDNDDFGVILDLRARSTVFVSDDKQAYFDFGRFFKNKELAPLQKAQRARFLEADKIAYVPSREKRTILGLRCEMFQGFLDGRVVYEVCAAPWNAPGVGAAKDYAFFDAAEGLIQDQAFGTRRSASGGAFFLRQADVPGLQVWKQDINADRTRGPSSELVGLEHDKLPAELFSVPEGYHETADMSEVTTPTPGRRATPAPSLSGSDRRPSAPSQEGRRVTGIIAVLLFVVGTLALLFHSWLLHLAAGFVLAEPRFIDAIVATLILWVAFVPLSLLGVSMGIALPVDLLAAYAGLKLSYRESTGRTVALLVVSMIVALLVQLAWAFMSGAFRR